jgi:hypothetical protein
MKFRELKNLNNLEYIWHKITQKKIKIEILIKQELKYYKIEERIMLMI